MNISRIFVEYITNIWWILYKYLMNCQHFTNTLWNLQKTSPDEDEDELNEIERRDNMLENLLILLNSAAALGMGPQPGELGRQYEVRQRSASEIPGSRKGIKRG
jgi:hypothetical protein